MLLNEFFDAILVINLDRRPDRLKKAIDQLNMHAIEADKASAYDGHLMYPNSDRKTAGQLGCMMSHLECIRYAQKNKLRNVLILEDDVEFHPDVQDLFSQAVSELPNDWDMLYLGGNTNGALNALLPFSDRLRRVNYLLCCHAYAINETAYQVILNEAEHPSAMIIDVICADIQPRIKCFKIDPNIAWQSAGFSDIEHHKVDYHFMRSK